MLRGHKQHVVIPDEVGQASRPVDGQTVADNSRVKAQLWSVGERGEETVEPPRRSFVHLQVPPRISSSIFFLDKSLLISLEGLCGRRGGGEVENRASYRSTLSVRLGASPCSWKPATASAEKKKDERCRGRSGWAPLRDPKGPEVKSSAPARRVNGGFGDSEERRRRPLGSRSFSRPSPSKGHSEDTALCRTAPCRSESDKPGSRSVHLSSWMQILPLLCTTRSSHQHISSSFIAASSMG